MISNLDSVDIGGVAMEVGAEQLGSNAVRIQDLPLAIKNTLLLSLAVQRT